jgi:hypothetical protein
MPKFRPSIVITLFSPARISGGKTCQDSKYMLRHTDFDPSDADGEKKPSVS